VGTRRSLTQVATAKAQAAAAVAGGEVLVAIWGAAGVVRVVEI
jgi:hypothetical protein